MSRSTKAELAARRAVVADMAAEGVPDRLIAARLGIHERTVLRDRKAVGAESRWAPDAPEHGTQARYRQGCRCQPCRDDNAWAHREWCARNRARSAP